jgi:hypothetical protein
MKDEKRLGWPLEYDKTGTKPPHALAGLRNQVRMIRREAEAGNMREVRFQLVDRNGKPIKSARYMRQFYGFTLETEIKCRKCGEVFGVGTTGSARGRESR